MRAKEFLFEYKRDITAQRLGPKLVQSGQREGITDVDKILSALEEMDPTPNKQYMIWLANQYIAGKFRLEDSGRIQELLTNFVNIKSRLPEKDIGKYDLHSLEDTIDKAMGTELGSSDALEAGTFSVVPDSEILYNGPLGQLAVPKTEKASCELGSGTKWCTAAKTDNRFAEYARKEPLYIWRDKNGGKYQFHFATGQFMDSGDRKISHEKLRYFRTQHPVLKKLFALKEKEVAKNPELACRYARDVIRGRFPEAEAVIAKDPLLAYRYAYDVIQGRWPKAEAVIATDPRFACRYAYDVIRGRFPEGEAVIATDPRFAYEYAKDVINGRWPKAEAVIAKDPLLAYRYAYDVINGRWPKAEAVIAKDPLLAYEYARDVIKGRFPEAESKMKKSPHVWPNYVRDLKLRTTDFIDEMALAKYQPMGDFDKPGPFRGADKKLVPHPKSELKTQQFFEQTPYDFRLFFSNIPGTGKYSEHGPMSPEKIREVFKDRADEIIDGSEDAITVVFVGNKGDAKVILTPWMMAHRLGHAVNREAYRAGSVGAWKEAEKHFFENINSILKDYYGIYAGTKGINYELSSEYNSLFNAIGTQRSSRQNLIRRPYEFFYELFAQYLGTGNVKMNPLPMTLGYGRKAWGRSTKAMNVKPEYRDQADLARVTDVLGHDMEIMFSDVLSNAEGKIFVM